MSQSTRISYAIMAALLVLIGWLHLGMLMLTSLFGYFALQKFSFGKSKLLGVALGNGNNRGVGVDACSCPAHALRTRVRPMNKMLNLMWARL